MIRLKALLDKATIYFAGGVLFIATILLFVGLRNPNREYHILYILIGSLAWLVVGIAYINLLLSDKKRQELSYERINQIKQDWIEHTIDLSKVKIMYNSYFRTEVTDKTRTAGLNNLVGRGDRNERTVEVNHSNLILQFNIDGKTVNQIVQTQKDSKTLEMLLLIKGSTSLYVNPDNFHDFYLDLEFLQK